MPQKPEAFSTRRHESQAIINGFAVQDVVPKPTIKNCIGAAFILTDHYGRATGRAALNEEMLRANSELMDFLVDTANGIRTTNEQEPIVVSADVLQWLDSTME